MKPGYIMAKATAYEVQIETLEAELQARKGYVLNTHMQLECEVLLAKMNHLTASLEALREHVNAKGVYL